MFAIQPCCCCCCQIVSAARDPERKPVLVFGEPGLNKDNVATLLHFGGPDKFRIMVQVRGACVCGGEGVLIRMI
jgi:hypothetical protein